MAIVVEGEFMASTCKKCGQTIYWGKNNNDKWVPLNEDRSLHFKTCGKVKLDPSQRKEIQKEAARREKEFKRKVRS